jgi:hypothetical protein
VLAHMRAAAVVYAGGTQGTAAAINVHMLLDHSGIGEGGAIGARPPAGAPAAAAAAMPAAPAAVHAARAAAAAAAAPGATGPAPVVTAPGAAAPGGAAALLAALPCLGPTVTLSDTRQSVVVHLREDVTMEAWASHFSPRKYDVKAGTSVLVDLLCSCVCLQGGGAIWLSAPWSRYSVLRLLFVVCLSTNRLRCHVGAASLLAEVVASNPLTGLNAKNTKDFARRIVYFDRGGIALRDKVCG